MEGDVVSSFRESMHIDAPPDVVWRLISDVRRHPAFRRTKEHHQGNRRRARGRPAVDRTRAIRPAQVRRTVGGHRAGPATLL
jgi:hypothetical protein